MPKYQCPDCHTVLRRAEAIPAGKKIRCPKCEAVFPAQAMADEPEPAKEPAAGYAVAAAAAPSPKPALAGEDNSDPYTVIKESGDEVKPEVHLGSLRDRFAKSKIGPAMFKTVIPSNWLLRCGLLTCVVATFFFIYGIWPIVFCEANTWRAFIRPRVDIMLRAALLFSFGVVIAVGAARVHDLTSFAWSIVGPIMALPAGLLTGYLVWTFMIRLSFVLDLPMMYATFALWGITAAYSAIGIWCFIIALMPDVREGFKERAEELEL